MRSHIRKCILIPSVLLGACFLATGCGPGKGSVAGKVTLDGKELKGGRVDFASQGGGQSASAEIGEDGAYTVPVLMAGEYMVSVNTEYLKPTSGSGPRGGGSGGFRPPGVPPGVNMGRPPDMAGGGPPKDVAKKEGAKREVPEGYKMSNPGDAAKKYVSIPEKYGIPEQSGLTFKGGGGTQTFDIPLTSK